MHMWSTEECADRYTGGGCNHGVSGVFTPGCEWMCKGGCFFYPAFITFVFSSSAFLLTVLKLATFALKVQVSSSVLSRGVSFPCGGWVGGGGGILYEPV